MNYRFKKIPVAIITISILLLLYSFLVRDYDPWGDAINYIVTEIKVPLNLYTVDFIFFEINFIHSLFILLMFLGIGIYLFLFQEDENIISGLKTKKEFLFKLVNSGTNKIRTTNKDSIAPKDDKLDKKVTSFLPSIKLSVKLISMIVLILIIGLLLVNYWINLSNSTAPLSLWEAFFLSYGKYVFLVALVMGALAVIQYVIDSKNTNVLSESENKSIIENLKAPGNNVENSSDTIPFYKKKWVLLVVFLSLIIIITAALFTNTNTITNTNNDTISNTNIGINSHETKNKSFLDTVELKNYVGASLSSEEVQNLFKQLETEPEISRHPNSYYYNFKNLGLSFLFTNEDIILSIFMYAGENNGYSAYPGKLPCGLDLKDNRREVEEKLGNPVRKGEGTIAYMSMWEDGISIHYKYTNVADMNDEIEHVSVNKK